MSDDKLIESIAARHALSSCLQRSGRHKLAQEAGGPKDGRRSAVGPDREQVGLANEKSHHKAKKTEFASDVPEKKAAASDGAGPERTGSPTAKQQGQSAVNRTGDHTGQQPGRKRRRSRSRRKSGNAPAGQAAQSSGREESHRKTASGNFAVGETVSNLQHSAERGPAQSAGRSADERRAEDGQSSPKSKNRRRSRSAPRQERADNRQPDASNRGTEQKPNQHRQKQASSSNGQGEDKNSPEVPQREELQKQGAKGGASQPGANGQQGRHKRSPYRANAKNGANGSNRANDHQNRPAYAALDLGTNNCRLLVAEPHGQSFRVVDAFSRIVRLGEGLSQTGYLSEDAQDRAISALKVCQSKLSYRKVKRFRLIATEACRRAKNGAAFLNRVHRETGLKLEIVNRETEARLAVAGCASLVHPEADGVVLFDIGGGSSEIVWLDLDPIQDEGVPQPGEKRNRQTRRALRHMSERIRCWTSLQVGVVTLSEKHGGHIVDRDQFEDMVTEVRDMLHHFEEREALTQAIQSKHIHMLGTSGTVTTLAGVHLGLERYDRRQVDGAWLNDSELRSMISRILEMDFEERTKNPCIGQDRADLVLAGCAILEAFHREWPCRRLRVADRGLREGILMEMMIDDGVWNPQHSKKSGGKKRRSRRRGGRGHRGNQTNKSPDGGTQQDKQT